VPLDRDKYDESIFQAQLNIILKKDLPPPIPPEVRRAMRLHELAESRARVKAEKAKWHLTTST
jgi:hypothetical protein